MATLFASLPFLSSPPSQPRKNPPALTDSPPPAQRLITTATKQRTPPMFRPRQQKSRALEKKKPTSETTDWIFSSLTRRFGLGACLAGAAFLSYGVVSGTRHFVEKQEEVVLPNGLRYYDLRVGSGASPQPGDLVTIDLKGQVQGTGQVFVNTFTGQDKKLVAQVEGSRPYAKGACEGIEFALKSMRAGGKRRVIVPPLLGFGEIGADFGNGLEILPNATLECIIEVEKVWIA